MELSTTKVLEVNINDILPSRFQPRIVFDETELIELSDSIKKYGVLQPLIVRKIGTKYEIIAGERRYKASVLAGSQTVPVIVRDVNDKESSEIALIENIHRKDLSSIEEALSYQKSLSNGKIGIEELSDRIGKSKKNIENKTKLLNLSDEVQEALTNKQISEGHARSLLKLDTNKEQNSLLKRIINERLTVKRTDEEIEKIVNENNKEGRTKVNNDTSFLFNNSNNTNEFNIFSTENSKPIDDNGQNQQDSMLFSTEPAAPTFINNNAPIFTQIPDKVAPSTNSIDVLENKSEEPMFVLFDDDSNNSISQISNEINEEQVGNSYNETSEKIHSEIDSNNQPAFGISENEKLNTVDNNNIFNSDKVVMNANNPEKSPIIISDFNRQFDPVMPSTEIETRPKIDMRSIINMIRNCQKEIENSGYEVQLDEYDLSDSYQVTFKIIKK